MATTSPLRSAGISAAREYQDLPAWQKSVTLTEQLMAAEFASPELKSLAVNRCLNIATRIAAASVRANEVGIAAGYQEAQSSVAELATVLAVAERTGTSADFTAALDEISRLLTGMRHGLKVKAKDEERDAREESKRDREYDERQARPKREFKPRNRDGDDRPRREYKPRDGGDDRPRREYKPRDGGDDRPKREYKPRDSEDRPKREYKPRDGGDRKPYGDKKPYGDRKPYGDKKPYGARSSGGSKFAGGDKKPFRKKRDD